MILDVVLLVGGIGVLYYGADWLVRGAARLAAALGISPLVVGLTVVAFGTSAPELVTCGVAVWEGNPEIAIGNIMGSNLANIGLILGLTSLVSPVIVSQRVVLRDTPLMILITLCIFPMLIWDEFPRIGRGDGIALLTALVFYLGFAFRSMKDDEPEIVGEVEEIMRSEPTHRGAILRYLALIVLGSGGLVLGGYAIVESAVEIARALGVSQIVIGLTLVAVGTSLPELATALVAAARKETDIAVGNIVGSNVFNFSAILGTVAVFEPIDFPAEVLYKELPAVVAMSLLLIVMMRGGWRIGRWEGAALLVTYLSLAVLLV